ncbi:type II secretion system inner membrane protein GspF [Pseudomonas aeruginosa]|uniref:type II secretion system inner membrane protein GspF n=1 Tax=Pseudomonas aeruginosa TaxID=287 RepID=UPI0004642F09|nr:type II secretion system inner membrane protein GspF [Pseudomonas aeruginosa]EIU1679384.1 type II secretion system inner membrane protein GspF [Pseudomonas aeruginosa]EKV4568260.1 type II secretion system inner membrane protein GspF [Pseudomonas aeruginosa]MBH8871718.1 type II secretion system inner membrane protein GspF [Pseudomonas aeruginosa]MBI8967391.1 type II secretion system inner membrane protein GspF [Pseudomonas aeruginosa]MBU8389657.1 type II secretion system inner membrane prote
MAAYEYLAMCSAGRRSRGVQEADSQRQARQLLRERNLVPLQVRPARGSRVPGQGSAPPSSRGLGASELAMLTRQLATLVQAALPLEEVLAAVAAQCEKRSQQSMLLAIRSRILEGHGLARAMGEFPRAFPALYRATVAAGERAGHLGQVLLQLADYTEARQAARQQIQLAMLYPSILLLAALGIVGFLLGFVVPDVVKVFVDSGQELPALTRGLIALSNLLRDYGIFLLLLAGTLFGAARMALRKPGLRLRWHRFQLRLPLLGRVIRASNCTRFVSTLAILGRSGVPLVDALEIASEVVANQRIRTGLKDVARAVREGGGLTRALEQSGLFPPMMLYMIASGERSGELDAMLDRAARQQETLLANRIAMLVGLFEPAMLVFMGASVLLIVLAILMPILSLNQLIT